LKGFGSICSSRTVEGKAAAEQRYFTLDMAFREGYARNRKNHQAVNLAVVRKITLNLVRLEPAEKYRTQKLSPNRKRLYVPSPYSGRPAATSAALEGEGPVWGTLPFPMAAPAGRASAYKKSAGSDIKGEWEGKRSG
jgi:hypothetical protein